MKIDLYVTDAGSGSLFVRAKTSNGGGFTVHLKEDGSIYSVTNGEPHIDRVGVANEHGWLTAEIGSYELAPEVPTVKAEDMEEVAF